MTAFNERTRLNKETVVGEKITRADIEQKLMSGENLENLDLKDLDLSGLQLGGISFRGSDLRGVILYNYNSVEDIETTTDISHSDLTDTIMADVGEGCNFFRVQAEGATFGFSETLAERRRRHREQLEKSDETILITDSGALFGFDGQEGNFRQTRWVNVDFGGGTQIDGADFLGADLTGATMEGCDLSGLDLSDTKIDDLKFVGFNLLDNLKISENQINIFIRALENSGTATAEFKSLIDSGDPVEALKRSYGIIVV